MSATDTTTEAAPESAQQAPPESSNNLLIEVDGKLVPNYDATIKPFEEGDVVSGEVVRIDKDEVLVDIGYKSEGVIPSTELSIRRSVDPGGGGVAGRAGRRPGAHQGGPGGAAAALQEAGPLREGVAQDRGARPSPASRLRES